MVLSTISSLSLATNITEKLLINTIQSSFNLMKHFVSFHHEQLKEVLTDHDLIAKLEIIQAMISDIESDKTSMDKRSIQKALTNLHLVIEDIQRLLENIDNKIKHHHTKYFSSWRGLNYDQEINRLKKCIHLMDLRYQMFLDVLSTSRSYSIHS